MFVPFCYLCFKPKIIAYLRCQFSYPQTLNSKETIGNTARIGHARYFENVQITIPHEIYQKEKQDTLVYSVLTVKLRLQQFAGTDYLIGTVESYIASWNEPGPTTHAICCDQ